MQYNDGDKPKRLPSEPRSLQTHARYFLYERVPTSAACLSIPSTLPASALPSPALVDVAMENANEVRAKDLPAAALPSPALVDVAMENANEVRAKDLPAAALPSAALVDAAMDNANEVRAKDFSLCFLFSVFLSFHFGFSNLMPAVCFGKITQLATTIYH